MKYIIGILLVALLAAPCVAVDETTQAYMDGVKFGYTLGAENVLGQTNTTIEQEYNGRIAALNNWMDKVGWTEGHWANLVHVGNYSLPRIFADPSSDWYKVQA